VAAVRAQTTGGEVEAWAFDEHRLGLKPLSRRVWAKTGARPLAVSWHKYQWLYLYAFVRPSSGEVEWWVANSVNTPLFQSIIDAFAKARGASPDKAVVVLLDNAGWHRAKALEIPEGLHFCFLPPYSPELQPAEKLWPVTDEAVANKPFETLDELTEVLDRRCSALSDQPGLIKGHTLFHCWPPE
jgi:hypothetical protein